MTIVTGAQAIVCYVFSSHDDDDNDDDDGDADDGLSGSRARFKEPVRHIMASVFALGGIS